VYTTLAKTAGKGAGTGMTPTIYYTAEEYIYIIREEQIFGAVGWICSGPRRRRVRRRKGKCAHTEGTTVLQSPAPMKYYYVG